MRLISGYMLRQNRLMHAKSKWGGSGHKQATDVIDWATQLGARTVLDYGCGRGTLKRMIGELRPNLFAAFDEYDPAVPGKDVIPGGRYDVVVCTDVMEHVEEEFVPKVLRHIDQLSVRGAFFVIACRPANKVLPDGQNAHVTLRPSAWWLEQMRLSVRMRVARSHVKMRKENLLEEKEVRLWMAR